MKSLMTRAKERRRDWKGGGRRSKTGYLSSARLCRLPTARLVLQMRPVASGISIGGVIAMMQGYGLVRGGGREGGRLLSGDGGTKGKY